ncbi:MAG: molybdopterin dinucleotide binding domain-containing protein [Anaerolineales bacterium]
MKPEERLKVAYVLARGGRFEAESQAYQGDLLTHRYPNPLQIYNETLGTSLNSMTGERFVGTPTWIPPVFADGTPVASRYSPDEWPFLAISTKSQYMSTASAAARRLRPIHPSNGLVLHVDDARRLGIQEGDRLRITSPSYSLEGVALVRRGIQPGVISIEHGYGRWGLGARSEQIGNKLWHASELRGAGLTINRLGISDPTRQGFSTLGDVVVGSNARQGVPVRVEKL